MKKALIPITFAMAVLLAGCQTNRYGQYESAGCGTGTNLGMAAAGALGGGLIGSAIGGGTGNTLATIGGAAAGGYLGSQTNVGCKPR